MTLCPHPRKTNRAELAAARRKAAIETLANCTLCAHECGVNRLAGELGLCRAGAAARIFSAQVEVSDELELIPTFAIAFSGCDLRCSFCITGAQSWNPRAGKDLNVEEVATQAARALADAARTIMILGGEPTIHLPSVLDLVSCLPADAPLIWKTNAHGSPSARALLAGLFDIWLADYKFGNDTCARRLAGIPNYTATVRENLLWAANDSTLFIRHLLMPGHIECCWRPVAQWISSALPGVKVNLRAAFWPGWQASRHPELCRAVSAAEVATAWKIARARGINLVE